MGVFSIVNILSSVSCLALILISILLYLTYFLKTTYSYWAKRGVPYLKPKLFFGNTKDQYLKKVHSALDYQRLYNELEPHKYAGVYAMTRPTLLLRDPETIRLFLVKSFRNFHDRTGYVNEKYDPVLANLVSLTGERWRNVRLKLVPAFSSGKLSRMHPLMNECIDEMDKCLSEAISKNSGGVEQNLRDLTTKLLMEVVGSCALGLQCNSIRNEKSDFRQIGRKIAKYMVSYRFFLRNILRILDLTALIDVFKLKAFDGEVDDFFFSVVRGAVKQREIESQKRNDFLQLLIDIQAEERAESQATGQSQRKGDSIRSTSEDSSSNGKVPQSSGLLFTDSVVVSSAVTFFLAGYDNTGATMAYTLYELALNPDICERVRVEIEYVKQKHGGSLDHDAIKELVYMDMVVSESLRKYPTVPGLVRLCTENFQIPETSVVVEKGVAVVIPMLALHHDPKYFPEPDKFDPDRFSEENKKHIVPGTYLPWGDGPRVCIGMRFASYAIKAAIARIVSKYTVLPYERTQIPLKFNVKQGLLLPEDGIWVQFKKRQKA